MRERQRGAKAQPGGRRSSEGGLPGIAGRRAGLGPAMGGIDSSSAAV